MLRCSVILRAVESKSFRPGEMNLSPRLYFPETAAPAELTLGEYSFNRNNISTLSQVHLGPVLSHALGARNLRITSALAPDLVRASTQRLRVLHLAHCASLLSS